MDRQEWIEAAKTRFDFETWPRLIQGSPAPRALGFALDLRASTAGWLLETRLPHGDHGYADYFHEVGQPTHRVMVRVIEHASHEAALQALLELLSDSMAVTLPRLDVVDRAIGDVAFRGHDDRVTVLFFVRHNILIDVRSIGDEPVSVLSFAVLADHQILAAAA